MQIFRVFCSMSVYAEQSLNVPVITKIAYRLVRKQLLKDCLQKILSTIFWKSSWQTSVPDFDLT